jgi:endo-1,4-beta-xylanase
VTYAGSSYQLCESTRTNQPSIDGTRTFQQYWAIRQTRRTSGTVDTGFFFDAWARAGMPLGNHYYMVLATEAYRSAGRAQVTILEGGSTPNPQPTTQSPQPTQNPGGGGNVSLTIPPEDDVMRDQC